MVECKCGANMRRQLIDIAATEPAEPEKSRIKKAEKLAKTIRALKKNEAVEKK